MTEHFDVIVAGAGPAGLLAARAGVLAGCRVALLERKTRMAALDRLCGQTLVSTNEYYFDELIVHDARAGRLIFLPGGLSIPYRGPVRHCRAWHIYAPDGAHLSFGLPAQTRAAGQAVGIACDKEVLLEGLLEELGAAGVALFPGLEVVGVEQDAQQVRVRGADGQEFTAAWLIAADGTNSRVARQLGFNRDRAFYCCLLSSGFWGEYLDLPDPDTLVSSICYEGAAPGFMFIFPLPRAGQHTVAFLALDPRVDLGGVEEWFTRRSPVFSPWFARARVLRRLASSQYVYAPVAEPCRGRVLLAGDAGACQELENTGALLCGWRAGCAVAGALQEERSSIPPRAIQGYLTWWRTTYRDACPHGDYLMNFALPYVLDTAEDLSRVCRAVAGPLPPCWNPYAAVRHMGAAMQQALPDLQREHPDTAAKLARMAAPLTEILAETTRACSPPGER